MPSVLICSPDYYGIEYEINPWMSRSRNSVPHLARQQWNALYAVLSEKLKIKIERIAPVAGLPDMVFTANAGLVVRDRFFGSRFRYDVRQGECVYYETWFKDKGLKILLPPSDLYFEGEGDALWVGETLFLGCQMRTDLAAQPWLSEELNRPVVALELVDPRFYHLDTCFCPLDDQRVFYYPPAFSSSAQKRIKESIPCPIPITEADALQFGANAIVVEKQVVVNAGCVSLTRRLMEEGFMVHALDLSEFIKAGGSAKCLILRLA